MPICIVQKICKALFGAQIAACEGVAIAYPAAGVTAMVAMLTVVLGGPHISRRVQRDRASEGAGALRAVCHEGVTVGSHDDRDVMECCAVPPSAECIARLCRRG